MEELDGFGIPIDEDFKTSARRFMDQGEDEDEVNTYIADFKQLKPKIKDASQKDIDKWRDFEQFKSFVDSLKTTKTKGQEKKEKKQAGAQLVLEDKFWRVYKITTHDAAKLYGAGTKWCITQEDPHYWYDYSARCDFYFYISKRLPPSSKYYKIALQVEDTQHTYWDATDGAHGEDERSFYRKRKQGSIPFNLPEIPGVAPDTVTEPE